MIVGRLLMPISIVRPEPSDCHSFVLGDLKDWQNEGQSESGFRVGEQMM
jgi:hypothetical protein